ncbi:hypothetical protein BCR39DRAFT_513586 [Naematelia encephala]|uniref:Uncharacterized protein n=1 Tax=Naematelia encephala TaxID=71784 RepID=A0A1Y2BIK2_9TREE|nr:hypothetical protein BCR39DRAFT_513586 [Naematelia encephala]
MPLFLASLVFAVSLSLLPSIEPEPTTPNPDPKSEHTLQHQHQHQHHLRNLEHPSPTFPSPSKRPENGPGPGPGPGRGEAGNGNGKKPSQIARKRKRNLSTELKARQINWRPIELDFLLHSDRRVDEGFQALGFFDIETRPSSSSSSSSSSMSTSTSTSTIISRRDSEDSKFEQVGNEVDDIDYDPIILGPRLRRCSSLPDFTSMSPENYEYTLESSSLDDLEV